MIQINSQLPFHPKHGSEPEKQESAYEVQQLRKMVLYSDQSVRIIDFDYLLLTGPKKDETALQEYRWYKALLGFCFTQSRPTVSHSTEALF